MKYIEDIGENKINKLIYKLEKIEANINKIIHEISTTSDTSNIFWARINAELRQEYEKARKITSEWVRGSVPEIYSEQVKAEIMRIKNKKLPAPKSINFNDFSSTHSFKQSTAALLEETLSTFATGYLSGEKTLRRLTSLTQQINLSEKELERSIAEGFIEKGNIQGSKKKLQKELLKKALDGKYVTVIDKNGNPEQWGIAAYAEMVARTKLHEASTQGVINTAGAVGADLIQISVHNTKTPYDAQFEGKIFSLSGNDKDFPPVEDLPPFHPNCLHTTSIVFKEALEIDGTLQEYIDFSNGNQEEHPTRQSFIPISEREFK